MKKFIKKIKILKVVRKSIHNMPVYLNNSIKESLIKRLRF